MTIADMTGHYKRSKWLAEQVALEKAACRVADRDRQSHCPGRRSRLEADAHRQDHCDFLRDRLARFCRHWSQPGGCARYRGRASARGRTGPARASAISWERRTSRLQQILGRLAAITGKNAPAMQVPTRLPMRRALITTAWANITGRTPIAPLEGVKMARKKMFVSHGKAPRELEFSAPVRGSGARNAPSTGFGRTDTAKRWPFCLLRPRLSN